MKPKIIYIIGAGNSGSTMLSMVLGAHSKIFSIGEFSNLDRFSALDFKCSCGLSLSKCEFWVNVNSIHKTPINIHGIESRVDYSDYIESNHNIYSYISNKESADYIIDSSKDLKRLYQVKIKTYQYLFHLKFGTLLNLKQKFHLF